MTPTALTLRLLRSDGWLPAVVERWIPHMNRRADLWRFGDILAIHAQRREFLIVQTTSLGNVSSRLTKAKRQPELEQWLLTGGRFEVHGWAMKDGKHRVKRVEVLAGDVEAVITNPRRKLKGDWMPAPLFAGDETRGDS